MYVLFRPRAVPGLARKCSDGLRNWQWGRYVTPAGQVNYGGDRKFQRDVLRIIEQIGLGKEAPNVGPCRRSDGRKLE